MSYHRQHGGDDGGVFRDTWSTTTTKVFLSNENYCNLSCSTKIKIFLVAGNDFPFSQYCIKPYTKKNLTDEEILFNYRLPRKKHATENVFEIGLNKFRIFPNRATLTPDNFCYNGYICVKQSRKITTKGSYTHLSKVKAIDHYHQVNSLKILHQTI